MEPVLRTMQLEDWPHVRRIYQEGIATGNATFQTCAPECDEWNSSHRCECRFIAEHDGNVAGWAAVSPVSGRCIYSGVAEVSVYVGSSFRGLGIGSALMRALIPASEVAGIWTLQSGIFPENTASILLHAKHGFREVGRRERIGQLNGTWRDVLLLERRSQMQQSDQCTSCT
jgi:L-amino acid N-acyltransferase YncA